MSIQLDKLFDANAHWRSGQCPWTFFAFPTSLADDKGLPPDADAKRLLGELQLRGIQVGLWVNAVADNTTYYVCPNDDIGRLHDTIDEFESEGMIEPGFLAQRSAYLFSMVPHGT